MKTLKIYLKPIACSLTFLILFQSCAVHQISLEQAVEKNKRVEIETKSNEKFEFGQIVFEEGVFYGIQQVNGKKVRVTLQEDKINSIKVENGRVVFLIFLAVIMAPVIVVTVIFFLGA